MSQSAFELLAVVLPRRERPGRDAFPTTAKAVRGWIEALPLANSGATARLLYNGLKELNQLELDAGQRIEILEQMRTPVAQVVASMERHVIGQPLPLPLQKRQIGAVMRDFHRELAMGYAICVHDLCAPRGAVPFLRGRSTAMALTRGLVHGGHALTRCYLSYSEIPSGIWALMHRMAAFAFESQLADKAFTDPQYPGITLTPESSYLQAALCAIGNPYRLTQKEIIDLDSAAKVWANLCRVDLSGHGEGFVIDPAGDQPPLSPRAEVAGASWRISSSELVQGLRAQLRLLPVKDAPVPVRGRLGHGPDLAGDIVQKLCAAWSFTGERLHPRVATEHDMQACIGLHGIHFLAAENKDFREFVADLGGGITLSDRERSAAWAQASSEQAHPAVMKVRVLDQSLGGYRLLWDRAEGLKAKVGELVALAAPAEDEEDSPDWLVGVLRWLKGGANDSLEAGVQLLSRRVEPIAVRAVSETQSNRAILRGLLLAPLAIDGDDQQTLLAPSILDASGALELLRLPDPAGIEERQLVQPVPFLELVENAGAYRQFRIGEGQQAETLEAPAAPSATAMDELWSSV